MYKRSLLEKMNEKQMPSLGSAALHRVQLIVMDLATAWCQLASNQFYYCITQQVFWKKRQNRISNQVSSPTLSPPYEVTNVVSMTNDPVSCKKIIFGVVLSPILSSLFPFQCRCLLLHYWFRVAHFLHDSIFILYSCYYLHSSALCIIFSTTHQSNLLAKKSRYMLL